ncbi:MAG: hypothetical protein OEZ13_03645 [Spirochaetia bacterium]|nr:hypothetical protein [Spirochaetia bacterium]
MIKTKLFKNLAHGYGSTTRILSLSKCATGSRWLMAMGLIFSLITPLTADEMPKLIILPFKNIDRDPNYEYLEASITEAIRDNLKEKFAFSETSQRDWKAVMKKAMLYEKDAYTSSFGMNLGLFAKQDVIINGGYYVKTVSTEESKIKTVVRIISITEKEIISEIDIEIPIDNSLFGKITTIADRAAVEASKVLPNKEDWEKNKSKKSSGIKIFSNASLGFAGGVNMFAGGWADQFKTNLPAFSLLLKVNTPIISDIFFIETHMVYFTHGINTETETPNYFTANNLTLLTSNYVVNVNLGIDWAINDYFLFSPKLNAGMVFQNSQVSGEISQSVSNSFFCAGAGFDMSYILSDAIKIVLNPSFIAQIESPIITYMPVATLGVNISF